MKGTFYVPGRPSVVPMLNLGLKEHEQQMAARIDGDYRAQLVKHIFGALGQRVAHNMDNYEHNPTVDVAQDQFLNQHSKYQ